MTARRCQAWVAVPGGLMSCGQPADTEREYACGHGHVKIRAACPDHAWTSGAVGCLDCLADGRDCELAPAEQPVGHNCPWCGEHAALLVGEHQAFCQTDGCNMLMWDPAKTRTEVMFGDVGIVDLRKDSQ